MFRKWGLQPGYFLSSFSSLPHTAPQCWGSNLGPSICQASAVPLSYTPSQAAHLIMRRENSVGFGLHRSRATGICTTWCRCPGQGHKNSASVVISPQTVPGRPGGPLASRSLFPLTCFLVWSTKPRSNLWQTTCRTWNRSGDSWKSPRTPLARSWPSSGPKVNIWLLLGCHILDLNQMNSNWLEFSFAQLSHF